MTRAPTPARPRLDRRRALLGRGRSGELRVRASRASPRRPLSVPRPRLPPLQGPPHHPGRTRAHTRARARAGGPPRAGGRRRRRPRGRGEAARRRAADDVRRDGQPPAPGTSSSSWTRRGAKGPESYTLTVEDGRVTVAAPAEAGVFYGTRTLKQEVTGGSTAPEGVVRDPPAKAAAGARCWTSRASTSRPAGSRTGVRELGDLKFNELGLHFSDDQGFRIASDTHPRSSPSTTSPRPRSGASSPSPRAVHLTVVPEIDSPGHLGAVLDAHPDLQLTQRAGHGRTRGDRHLQAGGREDRRRPAGRVRRPLPGRVLASGRRRVPGAGGLQSGDLVSAARRRGHREVRRRRRRLGPRDGLAQRPRRHRARPRQDERAPGTTASTSRVPSSRTRTSRSRTGPARRSAPGSRPPISSAGARSSTTTTSTSTTCSGSRTPSSTRPGERIYKQWTPRVLRGRTAVSASYDGQILGGVFAVWCDLAGSQTQNQVAAGIRMPLRATVQKLWDPRASRRCPGPSSRSWRAGWAESGWTCGPGEP